VSDATLTLLLLAVIVYPLKAAGPLALAGRPVPARLARLVALLPVPLLAALIVTSSVAGDRAWVFDARLVGLGAAAVALWRKLPFIVVVVLAGTATAAVRALF
jgi:hypothetical protein